MPGSKLGPQCLGAGQESDSTVLQSHDEEHSFPRHVVFRDPGSYSADKWPAQRLG